MTSLLRTRSLVTGALIGALAFAPAVARADEPPPAPAPEPAPHFTLAQHFTVDPVVDGVLIGGGAAFSLLLGQILSTGEIRPAPIQMASSTNLLSIDRAAVTQTIDPNAGGYSDIGLYAAIGTRCSIRSSRVSATGRARRPHYHEKEYEAPPMWIGYQPRVEGGGALNLSLRF